MISDWQLPATREELVNQLLVRNAPTAMIAVVERLPSERYESMETLRADLEEISSLDISEIKGTSYEELLELVVRNVGDVDHATKATYHAVVSSVIAGVRQQGKVSSSELGELQTRLEAAFADLRRPMSETYNYEAPRDPKFDLPGKED